LVLMILSSGPHHGHYVSIVKAAGAWKLFDDDPKKFAAYLSAIFFKA